MNRGAWRAMVRTVTKSPTQLKDFMHTHRKGSRIGTGAKSFDTKNVSNS